MQRGRLGSYCWTVHEGTGQCVDAVPSWPKAMWVRSGAKLKIRIHFSERPEQFSIGAWRRVDENGFPKGDSERIKKRMKRVVRDGETKAWDALFRLDGARHYYISAFGRWEGDASWSFHARTRRR